MANKIYFLSTCDTCKRILNDLETDKFDFKMQDIKTTPLSEPQIDELAARAGGYEALVNKRATLWKEENLAAKKLSEHDYKQLLLRHYTFLKRPVIDFNGHLFIGNEKKTVAAAKQQLKS